MAQETNMMRDSAPFDFKTPIIRGPRPTNQSQSLNQQTGEGWAQQFVNPEAQMAPRPYNPQLGNRWINQYNARPQMRGPMDAHWQQQRMNARRVNAWTSQVKQQAPINAKSWGKEAQNTIAQHKQENPDALRAATEDLVNTMAKNEKLKNSNFFSEMSKVANGDSIITNDNIQQVREPTAAESVIPGMDQEMTQMQNIFEKAYERQMNGERVDLDAVFNQAFGQQSNTAALDNVWNNVQDEPKTYELAAENKFADHKNEEELFELGMRLFNEGELKEAILAFQAVVEKDMGNSEAWRMLGVVHQELDEDRKAITCLENAKEQDPYNLNALLELGVSYVNELDQKKALANLKSWVQNNPKFAGIKVDDIYGDDNSDLMHDVTMLMTKVEEFAPDDPDVQVVMGVLFNVTKDYVDATRSFQKALNYRPNDYSLWNKLGATLANSSKSEEALPVYTRAIELKPKYARGWLNFGISHSNLGDYSKAIRAYLRALDLNPDAVHIWSYLRICLTVSDGNEELMTAVANRDIEPFRKAFTF